MTQPSLTPRKAKVLSANEALLVGSFGNVCLVVWRSPPTIASVERASLDYSRMKTQYPSGFAPVIIVEDGVGLPDEAARKALADLMDMYGRSMFCMAGVQEATGFRGAAIRSVLTAIDMLSQAPYPRKLFATVEQAAPWLAQHCMAQPNSAPVTAVSLIAAIAELRRDALQTKRLAPQHPLVATTPPLNEVAFCVLFPAERPPIQEPRANADILSAKTGPFSKDAFRLPCVIADAPLSRDSHTASEKRQRASWGATEGPSATLAASGLFHFEAEP